MSETLAPKTLISSTFINKSTMDLASRMENKRGSTFFNRLKFEFVEEIKVLGARVSDMEEGRRREEKKM